MIIALAAKAKINPFIKTPFIRGEEGVKSPFPLGISLVISLFYQLRSRPFHSIFDKCLSVGALFTSNAVLHTP